MNTGNEEMGCAGAEEAACSLQPKMAFMFLTRGDVLHPQIWQEFFADAGDELPIFLHAKEPAAVGDWLASVARRVPTMPTAWGNISLVRATLALMKAALAESDATHFVLLSESCVPIKSWAAIRARLVLDDRSRIGWQSYAEMKHSHRQRSEAVTSMTAGMWHFQHQWMVLRRDLVECALSEDRTAEWEGCFAPDEHYFITRFRQMGLDVESLVRRECSTWVEWHRGRLTHWGEVSREMALEWMDSPSFFLRKVLYHSDVGRWQLHRSAPVAVLVREKKNFVDQALPADLATGTVRVHVLCQRGGAQRRQAIRETWGGMLTNGVGELHFHLPEGEVPCAVDERCAMFPHWQQKAAETLDKRGMWERCEELCCAEAMNAGADWCFVCTDETFLHVPRLLALRAGAWECILPADDWQEEAAVQAGIMVQRSLLVRLREAFGDNFSLRRHMLVFGVKLRIEDRLGGAHQPTPRRANELITGPCSDLAVMKALQSGCFALPTCTVPVLHANWKDELEFYADGNFSRKNGNCMGRYELKAGGVVLDWFVWGREYLLGLDLQNAEATLRHYVIQQTSWDREALPQYKGKALYVSPVGGEHFLLESSIACMRKAGVDVLLIHYDDSDLLESVRRLIASGEIRYIKDRGGKWQLAMRHLSPESLAQYDHIMIWDDDMDLRGLDVSVFLALVAQNALAMSQPGVVSPFPLSHSITRARQCKWADQGGGRVGRLTNFVEIMVPCFSRAGWESFSPNLSEENISGYGYDYIDLGRKGIIDLMPVIHTRAVSSIQQNAMKDREAFFEKSGCKEYATEELGEFVVRLGDHANLSS
jgi:hypothetical protein